MDFYSTVKIASILFLNDRRKGGRSGQMLFSYYLYFCTVNSEGIQLSHSTLWSESGEACCLNPLLDFVMACFLFVL